MRFNLQKWIILSLVFGMLTACASRPEQESEANFRAKSAITGAVVGSFIGYASGGGGNTSAVASIVVGGLGAYAGTMMADNLNQWDRQKMREATFQSLASAHTGEPTYWESEYTSNYGKITPTRTYLDDNGRLCRDYKAHMNVDGKPVSGVETACLNGAGNWIVYPAS